MYELDDAIDYKQINQNYIKQLLKNTNSQTNIRNDKSPVIKRICPKNNYASSQHVNSKIFENKPLFLSCTLCGRLLNANCFWNNKNSYYRKNLQCKECCYKKIN